MNTDAQMHEAVGAIAATGVSPVVRIAANEGWMVKRMFMVNTAFITGEMDTDGSEIGALDAGAHGILVPLLETADDARKLVQSAKFPPVGKRGFGAPFAMGSIGNVSPIEYLQHANDALITAVQIETKSALDNVCTLYPLLHYPLCFLNPTLHTGC